MHPADLEPHLPPRPLAAAIAVAFVATLFAPALVWTAQGERDAGQKGAAAEERDAVPPPELELAALPELPRRTEQWFADGFPGRSSLVDLRARLYWFGLGQSPAPAMRRGRDGWLFFTGDRSIEAWRGRDLFSEEELDAWVERFDAWNALVEARDAHLVLLIAPNKPRAYPEHLPEWAADSTGRTRLDQLQEALAARTDVASLDVRDAILGAKDWGLLYFPHGTHWNDRGAWFAYQAIVERARAWFPDLRPLSLEAYREYDRHAVDPKWVGDSWAARLHLYGVLHQEAPVLQYEGAVRWRPVDFWRGRHGGMDGVTRHADASLPRLLLVRDSFGEWLWPHLVHHFSRMRTESYDRFPTQLLETERPDLVAQVRVERFLMLDLPGMLLPPGEPALSRAWLAGGGPESLLDEPVDLDAEPLRLPTAERGPVVARVEVEPGAASTLRLERGGESVTVELADWRRWAFAVLPPGESLTVRSADGTPRRVLGAHARAAR